MPFGSVMLIPGVDTERTPTLNQAGVSQSQLIRYKDALIQKYGGWQRYYPVAVTGTVRDLHAWQDFDQNSILSIAATNALQFLITDTSDTQTISDITPQTTTSNPAVNFTTSITSTSVTIVDAGILNVTTFDSIYLKTPVSVGGLILSGVYAIASIVSPTSYTITASSAATSSVSNAGAVPRFTTTTSSALVNVELANHGLTAAGQIAVFDVSTTGGGVTIFGSYPVNSVVDADNFVIVVDNVATSTTAFSMNSGNASILYYINLGPTGTLQAYGSGNYGAGNYGFGTSSGSAQTGTPITATDWTQDNWGNLLVACPTSGGIYTYDPAGGYTTAGIIPTAPAFNGGVFVSTSQQIVVAWASTVVQDIGIEQDPLWVQWSTVGDYTNWTVDNTTQAGGFRIPTGSAIMCGMAVQNQNLLWTDLDLWAMNYQGPPFVFGFNKIGSGAGAISSHAAQQLRGNVYWMGQRNFYSLTPGGVSVLPCPVWDFVFQNINLSYTQNVRAMPNTPFNEVGWLFPSDDSTSGECDSYVKFNITEPNAPWDYGTIDRSAWIDQTALGMPLAASVSGPLIYQHETTNNADGAALNASFVTGYFYIAEGEDYAYVDQILPDFKWGVYPGTGSASLVLTFYVVDFPGETPRQYGPYTVTQATEYVTVRFRGRQMAIGVQSLDTGSFWRVGRVRYRYAPDGRR